MRPNQGVNKPMLMALHQAPMKEIKQYLWRNFNRVESVFIWYALFSKPYEWRGVRSGLVIVYNAYWKVVRRGELGEVGYPVSGIK